MIISPEHKYVYVGIPRTASKSMNEWLIQHYGGVWYGGHHDYRGIPDGARSFLVFTIVRNPYDRAVSGYFGRPWDDQPRLAECRVPIEPPTLQTIDDLIERGRASDAKPVPYRDFVEGAGVSLLLYFERLPECLLELPFVDPSSVASFPHVLERGIRPPGEFRDFFDDRYEEFIWDSDKDDFLIADYERYDTGLPDGSKAVKWLQAPPDWDVCRLCRLHGVSGTLWKIAKQSQPLSDKQIDACRGLFAVQAGVHPSPAMRVRFAKAARAERMTRRLVHELAAFAMERS